VSKLRHTRNRYVSFGLYHGRVVKLTAARNKLPRDDIMSKVSNSNLEPATPTMPCTLSHLAVQSTVHSDKRSKRPHGKAIISEPPRRHVSQSLSVTQNPPNKIQPKKPPSHWRGPSSTTKTAASQNQDRIAAAVLLRTRAPRARPPETRTSSSRPCGPHHT
jgi:hypothetical protein